MSLSGKAVSVFTPCFSIVESFIGAGKDGSVTVRRARLCQGDANAECDFAGKAGRMHAGVNQKRRQLHGLSMPGVGQKYNELVSSDTGGDPAFRNAGAHDVGQLNQYTVAGQMAQRIVDGFKIVHVDHEESCGTLGARQGFIYKGA